MTPTTTTRNPTRPAAVLSISAPIVHVPVLHLRQTDGSILSKPGKPIVQDEVISVREAAALLGLSRRYIEHQCDAGLFKTAWKPGGRPRGQWRISRPEVLARRQIPAE